MHAIRGLRIHRSLCARPVLFFRAMSVQAAIASLPSPIKELVLGATRDASDDYGKTDADKTEVTKWIGNVGKGKNVDASALLVSSDAETVFSFNLAEVQRRRISTVTSPHAHILQVIT